MRNAVEKRFDGWIKKQFIHLPDVAKFLQRHERKTIIIDNICSQIRLAELGLSNRMDTVKWAIIIDNCAKMFSQAALKHKHEQIMSSNEKFRMMDKASKYEAAKEMIKEVTPDGKIQDIE